MFILLIINKKNNIKNNNIKNNNIKNNNIIINIIINMDFIICSLKEDFNKNLVNEDYYYQIFNLLSQLTDAPTIPYITFKNIVNSFDNNHNIYVYKIGNEIIGIITLIIEKKLIHNGKKCGHIEDLVVDKKWRSKGIANILLKYTIDKCRNSGCYKVILDCHPDLKLFYEKNNFTPVGITMRYNI